MHWLRNVGGRLYRGEVSFDFVGRQKLWYTISGLILVISIVALLVRGLAFSVDFKGGATYQFSANSATAAQVTSVVDKAGGGPDITVQSIQGVGKSTVHGWQVQTGQLHYDNSVRSVQDALASNFNISLSKVSVQLVGPSWGSQISKKALEALIAFLIVIVIYLAIAFEWRMSVAAFVALLHDIVITVGVYALVHFEVSPATVIGLLTILGYSLYDTVVVFDKVRENTAGLLSTRRSTYSQAANLALNQTLVRSINTSVIALLPVVAILIVGINLLGNGELKDLALVLFVGMLSGTYSSICIATPVLADIKERDPQYKQLARAVAIKAAGGRAAAKAKAKAPAGGTAVAAGPQPAEPAGQQSEPADADGAADETADDALPDREPGEATPDERVPVGRGASVGPPRARQGPRQQPRRTSAAKRRPGGKKKRR
ncbi:MAG TPA: protein translocase subunit SecF [Streptosporangiaceae bacterium]|jgi:preprotein translocase subunit SecF